MTRRPAWRDSPTRGGRVARIGHRLRPRGGLPLVIVESMWEQLRVALGLDEPGAPQTVTKAIQIVLVAIVTVVVSRWLRHRVDRTARASQSYADVAVLSSRLTGLAVYVVGVTAILILLGANWTALAAVLGAATLAISLSFQDVGRNFVDGIYVLVERPFRLGDRVRIGTTEGTVEEIGVRFTRLRTDRGERVSVPNNLVFTGVIENSSTDPYRRLDFSVSGIASPVTEIAPAVLAALAGTPGLSLPPNPITIVAANPDGAEIEVAVRHEPDVDVTGEVVQRLRARFPEATVSTKRPSVES